MMTSLQKSHTTAECHKLIHSSVHRTTDYPNSEIKIIIKSLEMQPHQRAFLKQNERIPSSSKPFQTLIGNANDSATFDTSLEVKSFSPYKNYISTICSRRAKPVINKSELFGNPNKTIHYCPRREEPKTICAKIQYRKTPIAKRTMKSSNTLKHNENCQEHGAATQKSASGSMVTQIKIPFQNTKNLIDSPVRCDTRKPNGNDTSNPQHSPPIFEQNQSFCQKSIIKIQENGKMINYCSSQPFCSTPIKAAGLNQSSSNAKINLTTSPEDTTLIANDEDHVQPPNQLSEILKSTNSEKANDIVRTNSPDSNNNSFESDIGSKSGSSTDTIRKSDTNRTLVKCFSLTRSSCRQIASTLKSIRNSTNNQSVMSAPNSPIFERHSIFLSSFNNRRTSRTISKNIDFQTDGSDMSSGSDLTPVKLEKSKSSSKLLNFFKNRILSSGKGEGKNKIVRNPTFDALNIKLSSSLHQVDEDLGCYPLLIKENVDFHNTKYSDEENVELRETPDSGEQFEFSFICEPSTSDTEAEELHQHHYDANSSKNPKLIVIPPSPTNSMENVSIFNSLQRPPKSIEQQLPIRRSMSDPSISLPNSINDNEINEALEASANLNGFVDSLTRADKIVTQANVLHLSTINVSRNGCLLLT